MSELPSGTVTFLFTDIEGSTRLVTQMGESYAEVLEQQRRLLRSAFTQWSGHEVDTQGDSFFVAFGRASDAVAAAVQAQRAVTGHPWPAGRGVRVRMGIHTGEPLVAGHGYVGLDVHRAARLAAAGHGGQVLLSQATRRLVQPALPEGVRLRELGRYRLRDLQQPEEISQVVGPGLPADFPALRTLDGRSHNLPIQATPLIGREPELAAALALLLSDDVRQVTLTGPGGSGKTRLGLQIAANAIDFFDDGIFFVGLAPIQDPALVPSAIARTLGVQEVSGRPVSETVKDYLQGKRLLLVLDNFEQLLPAAGIVAELLAVCPALRVLVTSRAVLRLYGEHHFPVSPLKLPGRKPLPPVERLLQYEAVRLFVERARAAKLDFSVTNDNAPAVAEICHRLDGLPLAIELAAARVRLLSPHAMLARLERRLPLLTGGARDLPARQQTLRDTIAWSHALLNEREQRLYRHLGVFVGGSTLEAIEAVAAAVDRSSTDTEAFQGMDALEGVASLVDNSLLRQDEQEAGEPRFWMLETIREYALERLEASGEAADARRRHADYYLSLAENAEPKLRGPTQGVWLGRLEMEHGNLRAALDWSLMTPGHAEVGLRLAGALTWFWRMRGHVSEGRRWIEATLNATAGLTDLYRMKALIGGAFLVQGQGHNPQAIAMAEEGFALAKSSGDSAAGGWALHVVARAAIDAGNHARAAKVLDESLSAFRDAGDVLGSSYSSWLLGVVLRTQGDYDLAATRLAEGLALAREAGDPWSVGCALHHTGLLTYLQGDYEQAVRVSTESLAIFHQLRAPWGISMALRWLAMAATAQSQLVRAARLFGAEEALRESMGLSLGASRVAYQRSLEATRAALGDQAFEAARSDGRAMTLDAAVAHALGP